MRAIWLDASNSCLMQDNGHAGGMVGIAGTLGVRSVPRTSLRYGRLPRSFADSAAVYVNAGMYCRIPYGTSAQNLPRICFVNGRSSGST